MPTAAALQSFAIRFASAAASPTSNNVMMGLATGLGWFFVWEGLLGCDIGGAKELGVIHFPTNWGAKEPQNLPNHRVIWHFCVFFAG